MMRINLLDLPGTHATESARRGQIEWAERLVGECRCPIIQGELRDQVMADLEERLGGVSAEPHFFNGWLRTLSQVEWARMVEARVPDSMQQHPEMWLALGTQLGGLGIAAMVVSDYVLDGRWRQVLELCGDPGATCLGGCLVA